MRYRSSGAIRRESVVATTEAKAGRLRAEAPASKAGEEERLLLRAQAGDDVARAEMLEKHRGLVCSVARKFECPTMELQDLIQEGIIGLARAIDLFDPGRGFQFSTYAVHWIRQAITRAIDNKARLIRMPVNTGYAAIRVQRAQQALTAALDRSPTVEEIAAEAGVPSRRVTRLLDGISETVSLEERPAGTAKELADPRMPTPEEAAMVEAEREMVRGLVSALPDRERHVIQRRFGLDSGEHRTLRQLAEELAMTPQGVRRIEARALKQLRALFAGMA